MTSVTELQTAERLAKTESLIDSVMKIQKQNDRMIRYGTHTMSTLMFVVVATFVGAGYQSIEVGKDIAALKTDVSSLKTDVSSLREEVSEEIAGFPQKKEVQAPPFFGLIVIRLDFQLLFHKSHVRLQVRYVSLQLLYVYLQCGDNRHCGLNIRQLYVDCKKQP